MSEDLQNCFLPTVSSEFVGRKDELFQKHYDVLKKLRDDSLIILDNFNVLPKDDAFFKELEQNRFQLLVTTRCTLNRYPVLVLKELDSNKELTELFYKLCPSAKDETDVVRYIIKTV